jgi:hypothetical protein
VYHRKSELATNLGHLRLYHERKETEIQGEKEYIYPENAFLFQLQYSGTR